MHHRTWLYEVEICFETSVLLAVLAAFQYHVAIQILYGSGSTAQTSIQKWQYFRSWYQNPPMADDAATITTATMTTTAKVTVTNTHLYTCLWCGLPFCLEDNTWEGDSTYLGSLRGELPTRDFPDKVENCMMPGREESFKTL